MGEQRPDLMGEPCVQFSPAVRIAHQFDAEPDLGRRYRADVEQIQRLFGDKCNADLAMWQLRLRISERTLVSSSQAVTRSTSRTGIRIRGGSMLVDPMVRSASRVDESCPLRSPAGRRESSAQ